MTSPKPLDLLPGICDQADRLRSALAVLEGQAGSLPLAVACRLYVLLDQTRNELEQFAGMVPASNDTTNKGEHADVTVTRHSNG